MLEGAETLPVSDTSSGINDDAEAGSSAGGVAMDITAG